jgi:hypothetical protein
MRVKQTFWLIVLSAISVQSTSSAPVPTFAEVQTKRIANPSIEVRDAQSLTSRTADVGLGNISQEDFEDIETMGTYAVIKKTILEN